MNVNKAPLLMFLLVVTIVMINILDTRRNTLYMASIVSLLSKSEGFDFQVSPLTRLNVNETSVISLQNKDIESWRTLASEHWNLYTEPEDLLKIKQPVFDKRFKNPCWFGEGKDRSKLNCLPFFFEIGVKKCGTTTLFEAVRGHPDIVKNSPKETQWLSRTRFGKKTKFRDFVKEFDRSAKVIKYHQRRNPFELTTKIIGEGTPSHIHINSHWRYLPENAGLTEPKYIILDYIHRIIPQAKIIIIFRDPIERLYSDYFHEYSTQMKWDNTSAEHFHQVVSDGITLYNDCLKYFTLRSCVYNETIYDITKIHIQLGIYHVYWEDLLRVFPRDQILEVHKDEMSTILKETLRKIYSFLGLRALSKQQLDVIKSESDLFSQNKYNYIRSPMLQETRDLLNDFYRPFNRKMYELTKDQRFLYQ